MLGLMGVGAVATGFALPALRVRLPTRGAMVTAFSLVSAAALAMLGVSSHWVPAGIAMLLFGAGWLAAASTLQAAAQFATPAWVRARAIGIYQLCFFGAMTAGAVLWGWAGNTFGIEPALLLAAAICTAAAIGVRGWRLDTATTHRGAARRHAAARGAGRRVAQHPRRAFGAGARGGALHGGPGRSRPPSSPP